MSTRSTALVIPAYNPTAELIDLVKGLASISTFTVLVVDDGSTGPSKDVFRQLSKIPNCRVVTHSENSGKGAALKTGISEALKSTDINLVITADADGQHLISDINEIASLAKGTNSDGDFAIFGVRDFKSSGVPFKSRFGNNLTSAMVHFLFGLKVTDTQTGLRGFSAKTARGLLAIDGQKYEYELNCLVSLIKHEVPIIEMPISTVYIGENNSTSHFKPIRDSTRIYLSLIRNFFKFSSSSLFSSGIDIAIYAILINSFFDGKPDPTGIVFSVVAARIVSSIVNLLTNRYFVFRNKPISKKSSVRYYTLAVALMIASAAGSTVMAQILNGHVVWAKILVDVALFIVSYLVQGRWVFAK